MQHVEGDFIHDRYEIQYAVSSGGMGTLYLAFDRSLDKHVAVKQMLMGVGSKEQQDIIERKFREEATILARLRHDGIPQVQDHFVLAGIPYVVMEFIEGENLESVVQKLKSYTGRALPADVVMLFCMQLCEILEYLHAQDPAVLHRDIKPANIMLRQASDRIVLVDFGVARGLDRTDAQKTSVGTFGYAPMEQLQGQPEVRSDLYAVGATMYHLLTGDVPSAIKAVPIRRILPTVNEAVAVVVEKAMSIEPEDRYQTAAELNTALAWALQQLNALTPPPPVSLPPANVNPRGARGPVLRAAGISALLLMVGIWYGLFMTGGNTSALDSVSLADVVAQVPIRPLPTAIDLDTGKVELGRQLFADKQLSADGSLACVSCHSGKAAGASGDQFSTAAGGHINTVNTQTVYNCGYNFRFMWDGRASTLEDAVEDSAQTQMGGPLSASLPRLANSGDEARQLRSIYGDVSVFGIQDSVATYMRSLLTPNAPFDRYLRGETDAINEQQKKGYELFRSLGCISCHQGMNVGGNMFERFGVFHPTDEDPVVATDLGRFNRTHEKSDRYVFRVPSLRNVALTAPYLHNGSADTLETAVTIMGTEQLGRVLSKKEIGFLVQFLQSLTGDRPTKAP